MGVFLLIRDESCQDFCFVQMYYTSNMQILLVLRLLLIVERPLKKTWPESVYLPLKIEKMPSINLEIFLQKNN
jgi:hypothetical protein